MNAMTAAGASFAGEHFRFTGLHSFPKPLQPGGVPVHIGGHSPAAARRAGRLGDGFQPLGVVGDELDVLLALVANAAEQAGRDPAVVEITLAGTVATTTAETVEEAAARGARRLSLACSQTAGDLEEAKDEISALAERIALGGSAAGGPFPPREN